MGRTAHPAPRVKPRRRKNSIASSADRHELYELSVQAPDTDAETLARLFKRFRKREALSFREDFCGTAVLSLAWVKSHRKRTAVGIDLDQPTMDWGLENRITPAGEEYASRIDLRCADVMEGVGPKVDLAVALNFSYFGLHKRKQLLRYFQAARRRLVDDGLLILDVFGGWDAMAEDKNRRKVTNFTYKWEQRSFNPLTHHFVCAIGFEFPDGSRLEDAFFYDWRQWTCPELRDALREAGFSKVHLMWERTDGKGDGTGTFHEPRHVDNQQSWWTYIVAER
ncbi:MAG: class I SAM-dependent methyltransferase [Deltaproteobacteria bacterium]|nr:class I SAM-dependent methyltransferase [Deltaproteobacteria bacterium]